MHKDTKSQWKVYRTYARALRASGDKPFISVGNLYLVSMSGDLLDIKLTSIEIQSNSGNAGNVTLGHLNRLGNANWATGHSDHKVHEAARALFNAHDFVVRK